MEIDSNTPAALGGARPTSPETDLDRDAFMRLLVAQIRNQDPMDPMDTRDMMSQLTELTSVEHLIGIEEQLSAVQVGTASVANAQVASFVGRTVEADTSALRLDEAGAASGAFLLDGRAEQVTVTIRDAEGRAVRTFELGEHFAGAHGYSWDGLNDAGARLPAGRYRIELSATDAEGAVVPVHTKVRGAVTGVSYEDGFPELVLDDTHRVRMGDVREVSGGPAPGASRAVDSYGAHAVMDPSGARAAADFREQNR